MLKKRQTMLFLFQSYSESQPVTMWTQNSMTAPTSWPQHCYQHPQSVERQPANKRTKKSKAKHNNGNVTGKPAQLVARRNARERRRVQAVNGAFARLRKVVPLENHRYNTELLCGVLHYSQTGAFGVHDDLNTSCSR